MTTPDTIEARLREIEAVLDRWGASAVDEAIVTSDVRWLVALVRRYRAALAAIADSRDSVSTSVRHGYYLIDARLVAREALNEEVTP